MSIKNQAIWGLNEEAVSNSFDKHRVSKQLGLD